MGWHEMGVMPGHALGKDGAFEDTIFFWKHAGRLPPGPA